MEQKASVVIAAYNEEPRISRVLDVVVDHPLVDEIIVVDDGSKDKTAEVVKKYPVRLIQNEKNLGKTLSVKKGIESAKNGIVVLLDADLSGFDKKDLSKLIEPVLAGKVDWTLSLRGNSWIWMRAIGMDWVSGERVLKKDLLNDPLIWSRPDIGFGLETLMNKSLLDRKTTFCSIYLKNLKTERKADKVGFWRGWYQDFMMVFQIGRVLPLYLVIGQFIKMAYLSSKFRKARLV